MQSSACTIDGNLHAAILPCMIDDEQLELWRHPRFDPFADPDGFPLCCISKQAIVYSCGAIARRGDKVIHAHPLGQIELCRHLASQAAEIMESVVADPGSEGTPHNGTDYFLPFFRTVNLSETIPTTISENTVRSVFGGTLFPKCQIHVERLAEDTEWWANLTQSYAGSEPDDRFKVLSRWRAMIAWFTSHRAFKDTVFVRIRERYGEGGSVFPRLALGLTEVGSLTGILGNGVHT